MNIVDIHAMWVGNKLNDIAVCCLKSFIMRGHKVYLHIYEKIDNVPEGIILRNAELIVPRNRIIKHKETGSYALFSDIFRYYLLKVIDGVYVDCDVYCLSPIEKNNEYLLGFEDDKYINGAVLGVPKTSILLDELLNICENPNFIPPWYSYRKKVGLKLKYYLGIHKGVESLPWGNLGPIAITYYINKNGLNNLVSPIDKFYPLHHRCINQLFDPELDLSDIVTKRSQCIHLYNELLSKKNFDNLHKNSLLFKFLNNLI